MGQVLNAYIHMHTNTKAVWQLLLSTPENHKLSRDVLFVKETDCTGTFLPFPHFPEFSAAVISSVSSQQRVELRSGLQRELRERESAYRGQGPGFSLMHSINRKLRLLNASHCEITEL